MVKSSTHGGKAIKVKIEDILEEQLKREMFITRGLKFRYVDDWDTVMHSIYEIPIEYDGYMKKVGGMVFVKEMVNMLSKGNFVEVKRSESRGKQMKKFIKTMHMYYNLIFTKKDGRIGYGALIHFPKLGEDDPERSSGIVLAAKYTIRKGKGEIAFEKAKFEDFLLEVKPYIEILGDLYRRIRKL